MIRFTATIKRFGQQGEKTGWTYIEIPASLAHKLKPGNKKSFRVKGMLDENPIERIALLPMGDGNFIMALNAGIRKQIKKQKGDTLRVSMEADDSEMAPPADFMECLQDESELLAYFQSLPKGHQNYFAKWIDSAKTEATKAKRIAMTLNALSRKWSFSEMIRASRKDKMDD